MKTYSIGREVGCDIVINDSTDVISRRHAVLNVYPSGKMTIVDSSHNGTYVNGIRISSNVPVPVSRKDNISFAHIARLDWNTIPNPLSAILKYVLIGVAALFVVGFAIFGMGRFMGDNGKNVVVDTIIKVDSVRIEQNVDRLKEAEARTRDSINKVLSDSIKNLHKEKALADSAKASQNAAKKSKGTNAKTQKPRKDEKKQERKNDAPKKEKEAEHDDASKNKRFV